jgi:hypothetical protein
MREDAAAAKPRDSLCLAAIGQQRDSFLCRRRTEQSQIHSMKTIAEKPFAFAQKSASRSG